MIHFYNVSLQYPLAKNKALTEINLHINRGEFVYLIGHSGAGKSSMMNLLLKRILPTNGSIQLAGENLANYKGEKVSLLRRRIGVIFQENMLLPHLTAEENVIFALKVTETAKKSASGSWENKINTVFSVVNLSHKREFFPAQLSQGEQQRVAIARAIISNPPLLLADEPTGNLDPKNALEILKVLHAINKNGTTVLMATHAKDLVDRYRHRTISLKQGLLIRDSTSGGYEI